MLKQPLQPKPSNDGNHFGDNILPSMCCRCLQAHRGGQCTYQTFLGLRSPGIRKPQMMTTDKLQDFKNYASKSLLSPSQLCTVSPPQENLTIQQVTLQCCPTGTCPSMNKQSSNTIKKDKTSSNVQLPPLKTFIYEVTKNLPQPLPEEAKPISKRSLSKTTIACEHCRKHHRKCSGKLPCSACDKKGMSCVYTARKKRGPKNKRSKLANVTFIDGLKSNN